jgi:malonate transporter and related proteins
VWIEVWRTKREMTTESLGKTILYVVKQSVIHPVILPILVGLTWNFAGFPLPQWFDQPLSFLASAAGPIMLVLMGAQLSKMALKENLRAAFTFTLIKNFMHPLLMFAACYVIGLSPLYTAVAVVCASLPTGVNAFIFAQRYRSNEDMVTAATAASSIAALLSVTLALALLPKP